MTESGVPALLRIALLSECWSSWRGLHPHSSPSRYTGSPPLKKKRVRRDSQNIQLTSGGYARGSISLLAEIFELNGYLQNSLYTGQCWDDSCWRGRRPLSVTPASLYWTSAERYGPERRRREGAHVNSDGWRLCHFSGRSLPLIFRSPWWHTGVHPAWIWRGWPFRMNLRRFSSPFRTCPC